MSLVVPRRIVSALVAGVVCTVALAVVQTAIAPPARAAEVPWECGDAAFLFQSPNGAAVPHIVQSIDLVTGAATAVGTTADQINAVAYNVADNYMYAWNLRTDTLTRVSSDLSLINLGVPANTPLAFRGIDYNIGDFDASGNLWIMDNQSGRWLAISLANPNAPVTIASGIANPPANLLTPGDWAFINGVFYGVSPTSSGLGDARLVSFNPATRTFTNLGILTGMTSGSTFGAVYSDDTYLYVSRNQGGNIYRVDPATVTNTLLSSGPAASSNDGARCRSNVIPTVTIRKQVDGRLVPADQFTVNLSDSTGATVATVTTSGTQSEVTSSDQPVERDRTYLITDLLTDDSPSLPTDYTGTLSCIVDGAPSASPPRAIGVWELEIGAGNDYVCTVTNTPDPPTPQLQLAKSVSPAGAETFDVGTVLNYSYVVTNTGNVPVTAVSVADIAFSGAGTPGAITCPQANLAPRASTTCSSSYTVVEADVIAGTVSNTARATGDDPGGNPVISNDDSAEVPADPTPGLQIDKTARPAVAIAEGQTITYTFIVTNTGNVAVSGIGIVEDSFNGSGAISPAACDVTVLIPGQRATCTASYAVTQADLDAGTALLNTAHAGGDDPGGEPVDSPPDDAEVPVVQEPALGIVKEADPTVVRAAGDVVDFTYTVTNLGNVSITDLAVTEDSFSGTGSLDAPACVATTLPPAASTTCAVTYAVTQADIDAGQITNSAHATGQDAGGGVVDSPPDDAVVGVVPVQSLVLVKSVNPATVAAAGDQVSYSYEVTNNGTATVTDLSIVEVSFTGTGALPPAVCDETSLAPETSTTCTATYAVTQADIDSGRIDNLAQARGVSSGGDVVSNDDDATVTAASTPALVLTKTASPAVVTRVGETITYRFVVTNTGNVTLTDIRIAEDAFTGSGNLPTPTCPSAAASLAPGASVTCTTSYRVTAADLTGPPISNTAHATGNDPGGAPTPTPPDAAEVVTDRDAAGAPRLRTRSSHDRVIPGQRFWDRVRVRGLVQGTAVPATARLYGPFSTRAAVSCRQAHLARTVSWRADNGWSRSPAVRVDEPGIYVWKVSTSATPDNRAGTHRCGLASEMTTVARPPYVAPVVNGGFSGTLPPDPFARSTLPVLGVPALALRAPVTSVGVTGGQMDLPRDVDLVAWLRRSARYDDRIGATVVAGHVSDWHDRPGAMHKLNRARPGQVITVSTGQKSFRYEVVTTATYSRTRKLPQRFFSTTGRPRLVLVSCTGRVVDSNGNFHYTKHQVVVAKRISVTRR